MSSNNMMTPWWVSPVAAGAAMYVAYPAFVAKTAKQLGKPVSFPSCQEWLKGGGKAAFTVASIVGTQMFVQEAMKEEMKKKWPELSKEKVTLLSSVAVGFFSSPALAMYNGYTMKPSMTWRESLWKFSKWEAGAITLQESGFIAGIAAAELIPVGDSQVAKYAAAGASAACGIALGHIGNTALTRWQNGLKVESIRQLSWGGLYRTLGATLFGIVYKGAKELLSS